MRDEKIRQIWLNQLTTHLKDIDKYNKEIIDLTENIQIELDLSKQCIEFLK